MTARAAVAAMTAYTLELHEAEVKLNQNESPYDCPEEWKSALLARLASRPWNLYPDFESLLLRDALAKTHGGTAQNYLTGNGSNELLAAAVGTFVGPGTPVVYPRPSFSLYEKLVTIAGGLPVPIDLDPETGELPLREMIRALSRLHGAVVICCSPNNPTGGVLPEGGLEHLLATGATVLFDRAYGEFALDSLPPLHDRLVTLSTFSKAWGLASLRVGWLLATEETCRQIRKVKLPYSLNTLSEQIAAAALETPEIVQQNVASVLSERARVFSILGSLPGVTAFPSAANFITFRSRIAFHDLCTRGVLVRDLSGIPRMKNCLRVSIGSPAENDRFLTALRELLESAG